MITGWAEDLPARTVAADHRSADAAAVERVILQLVGALAEPVRLRDARDRAAELERHLLRAHLHGAPLPVRLTGVRHAVAYAWHLAADVRPARLRWAHVREVVLGVMPWAGEELDLVERPAADP